MRILAFILLMAAPLHEAMSQARDARDTLRTYEMEQVVVTGTRVETARTTVPLTVSTVSGPVIEESKETNVLPVLSRRIPGLFVTERGVLGYGISEGSAGQIRIRGVGSSPTTNVLVLVDGHPQFMGIFGHPFPDTYVASEVERVEVVRGPASVLYGSGAMGGAINLITPRFRPDGIQAMAEAAYGTFGTQHYSGRAGIRRDGNELVVALNHQRTDGHRQLDEFWLTNGYLKAATPITRGWRATADGRISRFRAEDPGPTTNPAVGEERWADVLRARGSLSVSNSFINTEGAIKAFYSYGEHDIYDGFRSDDFLGGVLAYQSLHLSPATVATLGGEFKRYGGKARNVDSNVDFGDHAVNEVGGYGLLHHTIVPRLTVNAGARVEHHSVFGTEAAPQAGLSYLLAPRTTVKGSVARGFRSPTILELYLFAPANEDLLPERMWNYEVGVSRSGERYHAELVGFISEGSNLIQVEGAFPNVRRENVGEFSHRGVEFQTTYAFENGLSAHGNVAYLDMRDRPVVGAPEWHGVVDLSYAEPKWSAGLEVEGVSGMPLSTTVDDTESYGIVNLRLAFVPVRQFEIYARAQNMLDEAYQIHFGYPMPGRSVMIGLRARNN